MQRWEGRIFGFSAEVGSWGCVCVSLYVSPSRGDLGHGKGRERKRAQRAELQERNKVLQDTKTAR